ncbi:MAG: tripartite tricarboxylate transporter TctB family protein [Spirochaetaceae bacterium]|jgi:hypothetical protein|nr:tripartite tricarboxylate transporter TctB family protein [Spirochaetaceae bacterium]
MKKNDLIASIVFLILAGALFFYAGTFPVKENRIMVLNAGFYPQLLAVLLALLSGSLFISSLKKSEGDKGQKGIWQTKKAISMFLLTLGLLLMYPFALNYLGFASAAFLFIFPLMAALTENVKSKILQIAGISIGLTAGMYIIFKVILRIPFPAGIFI